MARMLPPIVSEVTRSSAEKRLFDKMKHDLSDEWTVIHSLGLASHDRKPWAEIDFVLIGPTGIFCVEVKGGRVERRDGVWLFTNRHDEVSRKREGPFDQVGSAAGALHAYLREFMKGSGGAVVGYGVCFPDISFDVSGPDIEPMIVYDQHDNARPFKDFVNRLSSYWQEWVRSHHGRTAEHLNEYKREAYLTALRGDFKLRPSLSALVDAANEELIRLTTEQERALGMFRTNARVLVMGCAGSGKTLLAVTEAERLAAEGLDVLVCCFNKNLSRYLQKALRHDHIDVVHLHGFMAGVIGQAGLWDQMPQADDADKYGLFFPMYCLEGLELLGLRDRYDVLVLDEAQDFLLDTYLEVLGAVLKDGLEHGGWRMFFDPNQNLFKGIGHSQMTTLDRLSAARVQLQRNCRNTAPVAIFTQLLSGIHYDEVAEADGPEVQEYWYCDEHDQRTKVSKCINRFLSEGIRPEQIVVLSPRRLENSGLRLGLRSVPFPLRQGEEDDGTSERAIRFATIGAFKGLEADAVVLVDLDFLSADESSMEVYVGASRAKSLLAVFLWEGMEGAYAERAQAFGAFQQSRPAQ